MYNPPEGRSSVTFYDTERRLHIILTTTNEKTLEEADTALSPILNRSYLKQILGDK